MAKLNAIAVLKIAPAVWKVIINGILSANFNTTAPKMTNTVNFCLSIPCNIEAVTLSKEINIATGA